MRLNDVGWVWEGQGLDPGVHPSIFGLGEGADFFGLRKVRFMFHELTPLAMDKLRDKEEVVCDISKWRHKDAPSGGTEHYLDGSVDAVCREAAKVSAMSRDYPNMRGGYYDDMKGLMTRDTDGESGMNPSGLDAVSSIRAALTSRNPDMRLECVVYTHELDEPGFWRPLAGLMDVVSLWAWGHQRLDAYEDDLERCREIFGETPVLMGWYLRDYPTAAPIPMQAVRRQGDILLRGLNRGHLAGFDLLGAVLIDGQLQQATWIRDFIQANS